MHTNLFIFALLVLFATGIYKTEYKVTFYLLVIGLVLFTTQISVWYFVRSQSPVDLISIGTLMLVLTSIFLSSLYKMDKYYQHIYMLLIYISFAVIGTGAYLTILDSINR